MNDDNPKRLLESKPMREFMQFWGECRKDRRTQILAFLLEHYMHENFEGCDMDLIFDYIKNSPAAHEVWENGKN